MKLRELKDSFISEVSDNYSPQEAESLFFIFLEERAGFRKLKYLSNSDFLFNEAAWPELNTDLLKLRKGVPYQHVLESVPFAGMRLKVSPAALIPRPETEELAIRLKQDYLSEQPRRVLDIGTGTGCLALACKSFFKDAEVSAIEISEEALDLARINAQRNGLRVRFITSNFLFPEEWPDEDFDLIVSNPPYIAKDEAKTMDAVVLENEPHLALFVEDEDPLIFYRMMARFAASHLSEGGRAYVEVNERLGEEVKEIFTAKGMKAELHTDAYDKPRFVKALK